MQSPSHLFDTELSYPAALPAEASWLIGQGVLTYDDAAAAYEQAQLYSVPCTSVLRAEYGVADNLLAQAKAASYGAAIINPQLEPGDPALLAEFDPQAALHRYILPWRRIGEETIVLTSRPDQFHLHLDALRAAFGNVRMAIATERQIRDAIHAPFARLLADAAEIRLPATDSCRHWRAELAMGALLILLVAVTIAAAFVPSILFAALTLWSVVIMGLLALLNLAAFVSVQFAPKDPPKLIRPKRLPTITVLVPLYKERDITNHLLERLAQLDYPRALLDVCLVMEESDQTTRATVAAAHLPKWARPLIVPEGAIRTKPRALNYALASARGSIIGIYDAEDAPERAQLLIVADHFANAPANTACLQGRLDYYNPSANWLTRCFTIEYASWFRVVLPGFARLGLAVPLGGTTLFFRRDLLEKLGAWDAHNVTEDADLGMRLARHGYRTDFVPTVTEEEANGHMWSWVRQRSRWLKGYAMTYAVHMRHPIALLRDVGLWQFFGIQMLFLGTLTQFLLAPLLWSFWLIPLGGTHPLSAVAPQWVVIACTVVCVSSAAINLIVQWDGVRRAGKSWLMPWALSMMAYFPLATLAVYKGVFELAWKPFYWDKTTHGVLMPKRRG